jgi:hypothetical protein
MIGKKNTLRTADKFLYLYFYFAPLSSSILILININKLPQKKMCSKCQFILRICQEMYLEFLVKPLRVPEGYRTSCGNCLKSIGDPPGKTYG